MEYDLSILFILRKSKANSAGQIPIYLRITVNGERVEISANHKIELIKWDSKLQRAKGKSEAARTLNGYLDSIENRVKRDYSELLNRNEVVSSSLLRDLFVGKNKKTQYLVDIFEKNNKFVELEVGTSYTKNTYDRYKISIERLKKFLQKEYCLEDIRLDKLDHGLMLRYNAFLRTEYSCGHNTAMKYLKHLKKVIHFAMKMGYIDKDPFFQYKTSYKEVNRGYLTAEELREVENHTFRIKRLEQVRDVFVFVCYTGLSYSDLKKLTPSSISKGIDAKNWIIYEREKTGVRSSIPILPPAQAIIDKYKNDPGCIADNKLLPVKSNQKINSYLSEIAELCGIDKHVTMHLGRHTFATTVTLTNGVPIETVQKMLGHKDLSTTQIYSKVVDTKISNDMEALEKKLNKPIDTTLKKAK